MIRVSMLLVMGWMIFCVAFSTARAQSHDAVHAVASYCQHVSVPIYDGYVEGRVTPGNARTLGDFKLFVPLWQANGKSLLFADLRGQMDDSSNYEGNWGVGFRHLTDNDWVLGGYGYYDSRWSYTGNQFNQMTLGIEAMSVEHELRMNGYLPDTNVRSLGYLGNPTVQVTGNQLVMSLPSQQFEVAYYGLDAEYGRLLASWGPNNDVEWRAFAGAYHFDSDEDVSAITGPRLRTELRLFDLEKLGEGSRVTLEAIYQWDQVRKDQYFAGATVRIPFGPGSSQLNPLQRRMVDRVVRDVDVVAGEGIRAEASPPEAVVYASNGTPIDEVHTIGSGDDFEATVGNTPENSLLVIDGTNTGSSQQVNLKKGQVVVGGGKTIQVQGTQSGLVANYTTSGTAGSLVDYEVHVTDGNVLHGLTLNRSSSVALYGSGAQRVVLQDVDVPTGHTVFQDGGSYLIENSRFTSPDAYYTLILGNGSLGAPGTPELDVILRDSVVDNGGSWYAVLVRPDSNTRVLIEDSTIGTIYATNQSNHVGNVTIRNNTFQNVYNNRLALIQSVSSVSNFNMTGNSPASAGNIIEIASQSAPAEANFTQDSASQLATENGILSANVTEASVFGGVINFGQGEPALPTWP
ncbi:inverse autotransporter beta domain-containing protein [Bremerella sp. JC770]|uniref:inverse autotransporter beta domain-containing protein n=1 Tax=Bremerella sp. JC770 TaxID=3232137 RepID=UPI003457AD86